MKVIETEDATFYVGQNCLENDELFKTMPVNSTWFHMESESSSHVYCVLKTSETHEGASKKISKDAYIRVSKKGAELVRLWSKKSGKVIYITKNKLKRLGPGLIDLLGEPKYA